MRPRTLMLVTFALLIIRRPGPWPRRCRSRTSRSSQSCTRTAAPMMSRCASRPRRPRWPGPSYGSSAQLGATLGPEPELRRNHRFDVTGVPLTESRFVRPVAVGDAGTATGEVVRISSPGPFPAGSATLTTIPLTVTDTENVARSEPVTFGIPLPQGALGDRARVQLMDGDSALPIATTALLRWPDRTIKWLLIDTDVALAAGQTKQLQLRIGSQVSPAGGPSAPLVQDEGGRLVVDTGAARLVIDNSTGAGSYSVNGAAVSSLPGLAPDDRRRHRLHGPRRERRGRGTPTPSAQSSRSAATRWTPRASRTSASRCVTSRGAATPTSGSTMCSSRTWPGRTTRYEDEMRSFASLDLVFTPAGQARAPRLPSRTVAAPRSATGSASSSTLTTPTSWDRPRGAGRPGSSAGAG